MNENAAAHRIQELIALISTGTASIETYEQLIKASGGSITPKGFLMGMHYLIIFKGNPYRVDRFEDLKQWFLANVAPLGDSLALLPSVSPTGSHLSASGEVQCIACGSTQLHSGQRGYSFMRGGIFGSSQIVITCLKCGQTFRPGGQPF